MNSQEEKYRDFFFGEFSGKVFLLLSEKTVYNFALNMIERGRGGAFITDNAISAHLFVYPHTLHALNKQLTSYYFIH
jgi:hypothetical protein